MSDTSKTSDQHDDGEHSDPDEPERLTADEWRQRETADDSATSEQQVDGDAETDEESNDDLSFALLAVALLLMVGASVYFVGTLLGSDEETAAAQDRAAAQIEAFEATPNSSAPSAETTPSTLPLADEVLDGSDSQAEPNAETEQEPEFDETQAPSPNVNPQDIGIAFVDRTPGDSYGTVGYIDRQGTRQSTNLECVRLDLNANGGICLDDTSGLGGGGRGLVLGPDLNPSLRFGINLPSRAAASPDGEIVAWTGFAVGHSYLDVGEFATTTQLIEVERGIGANLESSFATFGLDNTLIDDETRNFWGVTFVDSETFYATIGIGEDTSIVQGSIANSRMQVVHENATCPEVSPDGSTLVVKERRDGDFFQLVAINTTTGERRDLPEARTVEDQVEFLDDSTIIYGLPNEAEGTESQPAWDIWSLDLNGGSPQLIIPFADSPAAI